MEAERPRGGCINREDCAIDLSSSLSINERIHQVAAVVPRSLVDIGWIELGVVEAKGGLCPEVEGEWRIIDGSGWVNLELLTAIDDRDVEDIRCLGAALAYPGLQVHFEAVANVGYVLGAECHGTCS